MGREYDDVALYSSSHTGLSFKFAAVILTWYVLVSVKYLKATHHEFRYFTLSAIRIPRG